MFLAPQHFQAQRHHFEGSLAHTLDALFPFAYGWTRVALNADALAGGTLALEHARGILPDGTPVSVPDLDPAPPPAPLADRFSPTRDSHLVLFALPAWRPDVANVSSSEQTASASSNGADTRFVITAADVRDETNGQDATTVQFALKNARLLLDSELSQTDVSLPVARVRRDGAGQFVIDAEYVPPCLQVGASERLLSILRSTLTILSAKGEALAGSLGSSVTTTNGGGAGANRAADGAAYVGNELATRWLLHAIRSAEPPLRHVLETRRVHPEHLWLELSRLAGALCTFSLSTAARDLPVYTHDDLGGCFAALARHLRAHLDTVITTQALVVPLVATSDVLRVGNVADPRCYEPGARWFLGVRSPMPAGEVIVSAPQLLKICASRFVLELVRRAYPGLAMEHVPVPPAALAPRRDLTYFEITMVGPCAQSIRDQRDLAVYVPDAIKDATLELAVLVP
jgi:type VI secretion system protein ImpJ